MDKFMKGLTAGIVGGVMMNILDFIFYYIFTIVEIRFLDWASIFTFGRTPNSLIEIIFSLLSHILWTGFLGVLFAFLVPLINSKFLYIKGAFYGFIVGFIIYSIPILFQTPILKNIPTFTAITNTTFGIIFGLTLAYMLKIFDYKTIKNN